MKGATGTIELADEAASGRFGGELALFVRRGDFIALSGEPGAGKSTIARSLIRAFGDDPALDVPSPTYGLVQTYRFARGEISHFDLYRLENPQDIEELGFDDALARGIAVMEWPERLGCALPGDRLEIALDDGENGGRTMRWREHGNWAGRMARMSRVARFLEQAHWGAASRAHMSGDASTRRYERLVRGDGARAVLMDTGGLDDEPDPYADAAHLQGGVAPFSRIARDLRNLGLSAPEILAQDSGVGLLLCEDLGDAVYTGLIAAGLDMAGPYRAAVDVLVELARAGHRAIGGVAQFDTGAMGAELGLLLQWYWPYVKAAPVPARVADEFRALWDPLLRDIPAMDSVAALRDYHSPNLIWLADRTGPARAGLLDFQDAVMTHPAYDLVSLLQDARCDVPKNREDEMLAYYFKRRRQAGLEVDEVRFARAYAILGAQRNSKILGVFARLLLRDGKPAYLAHMDRVRAYLRRDLGHPALGELRRWYDRHFPPETASGTRP